MTKDKLPTIKLKGKDYVQVKDRLLFFNETYENGSIQTEVKFNQTGEYAYFTATIYPDVDAPERKFIARSCGSITGDKAAEKLETVAVGRALAFMGIGVLESVASADEMQSFHAKQAPKRTAPTATTRSPNALQPLATGDKLETGISKKTGNPYWCIRKADTSVIWLTETQYDYYKDMSAQKTAEVAQRVLAEPDVPLPPDYN